ncbi:hypothetical protein BJ742DRAFT_845302 [Cladochytrium replicatum]|nr:hypothetical protein BJ742DRAFT_845302 [Cladochytrium replicatum]
MPSTNSNFSPSLWISSHPRSFLAVSIALSSLLAAPASNESANPALFPVLLVASLYTYARLLFPPSLVVPEHENRSKAALLALRDIAIQIFALAPGLGLSFLELESSSEDESTVPTNAPVTMPWHNYIAVFSIGILFSVVAVTPTWLAALTLQGWRHVKKWPIAAPLAGAAWLVFPLLWAGTWRFLAAGFLPLGTWGNLGSMFLEGFTSGSLSVMSTFGPMAGDLALALISQGIGEFVVGRVLGAATEAMEHRNRIVRFERPEPSLIDLSEDEETGLSPPPTPEPLLRNGDSRHTQPSPTSSEQHPLFHTPQVNAENITTSLRRAFFAAAIATPFLLSLLSYNYSFSTPAEQLITVGCVLPPSYFNPDPPSPDANVATMLDIMVAGTRALASTASLVLWSEAAVHLPSQKHLDDLLTLAKSISRERKTYIGITYTIPADPSQKHLKNMLALVGPTSKNQSDLLFSYQKTQLIFIAESHRMVPGPGVLPLIQARIPPRTSLPYPNRRKKPLPTDPPELGISAAICHDLDYPSLILQASRASILLAPAQTWSQKSGRAHLAIARARASEVGSAVLRCDAGGVSGYIDARGTSLYTYGAPGSTGNRTGARIFAVDVPVRVGPKQLTWYAFFGDWIVLLAMAGVGGAGVGVRSLIEIVGRGKAGNGGVLLAHGGDGGSRFTAAIVRERLLGWVGGWFLTTVLLITRGGRGDESD